MKRIFSIRTYFIVLSIIALISFLYQFITKDVILIKDFNLVLLFILSLILAVIAAYGETLIGRIRKIGLLELATGETISQVLNLSLPTGPEPFIPALLSPEYKYYYEEVNDFLIIVAARGIEPHHMNKSLRSNYEKALLYAGRYSYLNGEYLKSIKLLELLLKEATSDYQDITKFLAEAYLWASDYKTGEEKDIFVKKAINFYEQHIPKNVIAEPKDYYRLAWAYDEIGLYEKAIENNLKAIKINNAYYDSYYNIAASYAKWGKPTETLEWIEKTPSEILKEDPLLGGDILNDPDFDSLKTGHFKTQFEELLKRKGIIP